MSFIRHKLINKAKYAYEITAYWDKELKKCKLCQSFDPLLCSEIDPPLPL